jgi:hypothetical protein
LGAASAGSSSPSGASAGASATRAATCCSSVVAPSAERVSCAAAGSGYPLPWTWCHIAAGVSRVVRPMRGPAALVHTAVPAEGLFERCNLTARPVSRWSVTIILATQGQRVREGRPCRAVLRSCQSKPCPGSDLAVPGACMHDKQCAKGSTRRARAAHPAARPRRVPVQADRAAGALNFTLSRGAPAAAPGCAGGSPRRGPGACRG